MARKISAGSTGGAALAGFQAFTTTITSAPNLDIVVDPAGSGRFLIDGNAQLQAQSDLRFADADSSNYVALQAPAVVPTNYTWTLPSVDGTSDQVLTTNATGTLSWTSKSVVISNQTTSATIHYPLFTTSTSGTATLASVSTTKLTYQPSTGTLTVTNFVESSSITLKENFTMLDNALNKILSLQGWKYDRKDGSIKDEIGLIAEDVNKIIPEVVSKDDQGNPSSIAYQRIVAYLIEAVKSLKFELDEIKGLK